MRIKKALISVSDKTNIVVLAKKLQDFGIEIISTGGTKKELEANGLLVTEISAVTKNPEAFGGRMKTISFQIESALLFDRENDIDEAKNLDIEAIDLVICNLYPFEKVLKKNADFDTLIENIDIGGPTMIRAAAKNFKFVTVVTAPDDYIDLMAELDQNNGGTSYNFRKALMAKAFNHTADYDALIAQTMDACLGKKSLRLNFENGKPLRYGENSHQSALFYQQKGIKNTLHDIEILHGKELSYNNILDISGAINALKDLQASSCSIIKHSNPCGLAMGNNQRNVLEKAWQADSISAFGSIIAFNRTVTLDTVSFFELNAEDKSKRKFIEVIVAPAFDNDALLYLKHHKDLRVLQYNPALMPEIQDYRYINGTLLSQDYDTILFKNLNVVTNAIFDIASAEKIMTFGLNAVKHIKSNAIAIVGYKENDIYLMGMGAGQPNRLIATNLALQKAKDFLKSDFIGDEKDFENYYQTQMSKTILFSDAFFPFADNVTLAAAQGIKTIVQPGGSIRDKSIIETCNLLNINMITTNIRHFKH